MFVPRAWLWPVSSPSPPLLQSHCHRVRGTKLTCVPIPVKTIGFRGCPDDARGELVRKAFSAGPGLQEDGAVFRLAVIAALLRPLNSVANRCAWVHKKAQ